MRRHHLPRLLLGGALAAGGLAVFGAVSLAIPGSASASGPAHAGQEAAATSVRTAADTSAQQLVYYDDQCGNNCTYSIKVFGYNQNHYYNPNGNCFATPLHTTVTSNWWWVKWNGITPQVFLYHNYGCPSRQAFLQLNFTPDGTTPYRCLSDRPPYYPDWSCPHP
jgi:hypothetical protein